MRRILTAAAVILGTISTALVAVPTGPALALTGSQNSLPAPQVPSHASAATLHGVPLNAVHLQFKMPANATPGQVIPLSGTIYSTFDFWNCIGGPCVAHFSAELEFLSRTAFYIYDVNLRDTNCDARSVMALAYDNNVSYVVGTSPQRYTWKNSKGCGQLLQGQDYIFASTGPVKWVQIALWAGNLNGRSSVAFSLLHDNPYY